MARIKPHTPKQNDHSAGAKGQQQSALQRPPSKAARQASQKPQTSHKTISRGDDDTSEREGPVTRTQSRRKQPESAEDEKSDADGNEEGDEDGNEGEDEDEDEDEEEGDDYLGSKEMSEKSRREMVALNGKVRDHWKISVNELLQPQNRPERYSKALVKSLASLSAQCARERAEKVLEKEIHRRWKTRVTPRQPTDLLLKRRDVERAIKITNPKRPAEEPAIEDRKKAKRPKTSTPPADDGTENAYAPSLPIQDKSKSSKRMTKSAPALLSTGPAKHGGSPNHNINGADGSDDIRDDDTNGVAQHDGRADDDANGLTDHGDMAVDETGDISIEYGRNEQPLKNRKHSLDEPELPLDLSSGSLGGLSPSLMFQIPGQKIPLESKNRALMGTLSHMPSPTLVQCNGDGNTRISEVARKRPPSTSARQSLVALNRCPLPTTDVLGALTTLQPGQMLSATALELVLKTLDVKATTLILDPQAFKFARPGPRARKKDLGPRIKQVIVPLHHGQTEHWTLMELDTERIVIRHYDSLGVELTQATKEILSDIAEQVTETTDWNFENPNCPVQLDSFNCGIHVLVTALLIITNPPDNPLKSYNCVFWRCLFSHLIDPRSPPLAPAQTAQTDSGILTPPKEKSERNVVAQNFSPSNGMTIKQDWQNAVIAARHRSSAYIEARVAWSALCQIHRDSARLAMAAHKKVQATKLNRELNERLEDVIRSYPPTLSTQRQLAHQEQEREMLRLEETDNERHLSALRTLDIGYRRAIKFAVIQHGICATRLEQVMLTQETTRKKCMDLKTSMEERKRQMEVALDDLGTSFLDFSADALLLNV